MRGRWGRYCTCRFVCGSYHGWRLCSRSPYSWGRRLTNSASSRQIFVAFLPRWLDDATAQHLTQTTSTAVVIDTLRFTTTACCALHNGATSVRVAATVAQARELAVKLPTSTLLCGERQCHAIEGFDLGNSPLEYVSTKVANRELIFTTTNGTVAVEAVKHARNILLAALVNRSAACRYLRHQLSGDIAIVCAGTDSQIASEDVLTAGAIADELLKSGTFCLGHDAAKLAHRCWQAIASAASPLAIYDEFCQALGGRNLLDANYDRDIHFAAQLDSIDAVPRNVENDPRHFNLTTVL